MRADEILDQSPEFIRQYSFDRYDIEAMAQGGCVSGAFMPAVTYYDAVKFMGEWGWDVLEYIDGVYGEIPPLTEVTTWGGVAVFYMSLAFDLWAVMSVDLLDPEEEDEE